MPPKLPNPPAIGTKRRSNQWINSQFDFALKLSVFSSFLWGYFFYNIWDRKARPPPATGESVFDHIAQNYDNDIMIDEVLSGMTLMRRWLVGKATGNVLEVSAGTGRNLAYYDRNKVQSLTLADTSRQMLLVTKDKVDGASSWRLKAAKEMMKKGNLHLSLSDVQRLICDDGRAADDHNGAQSNGRDNNKTSATSASSITAWGPALRALECFEPNSFDTVVDTFGLCSCEDPDRALAQMVTALKPGGQLLLLQHGESHYDYINNKLSENVHEHRARWGCEWNRKIEEVVNRVKGVEILSMSRWHFGTTYIVVAQKTHGV